MGFGLIYAYPFHEPAILLWCQGFGLTFLPRPLEAAGFQTLIQQNESIAFPIQRLDSVPPPTTEQEQRISEGIQLKLLLNNRGQSVNPKAQIRVTAGDINPVSAGEIAQHDFSIRSTVSTVAASAPLCISASAPAIRIVTATAPEDTG